MQTMTRSATGTATRFEICLAALLREEGGLVNDAADRGGITNFGISLRFAAAEAKVGPVTRKALDMDMDGDVDAADIRKLTRAAAAAVYRRCFWDRLRCDELPLGLDSAVFDQGVNGGNGSAIKLLQRAINAALPGAVTVDGVMGAATIAAAKRAAAKFGAPLLLTHYRGAAAARYRAIVTYDPSQGRFLNGWLARAARLGTV